MLGSTPELDASALNLYQQYGAQIAAAQRMKSNVGSAEIVPSAPANLASLSTATPVSTQRVSPVIMYGDFEQNSGNRVKAQARRQFRAIAKDEDLKLVESYCDFFSREGREI